jgi:hypothetical protein
MSAAGSTFQALANEHREALWVGSWSFEAWS